MAALLSISAVANGVLLFRTGDLAANTTEPKGALAGSGWQYEGTFGAFLGTAIAPHFFVTAKHIGTDPTQFSFHGVNYTIVRSFADPNADLQIFEVSGTLPLYAPLYSRSDEVGKRLVVIGRGTQRGSEKIVNGQLRGWNWATSDLVQRWGENQVASIVGDQLYALFDQAGLPQEAHISGGDSGGAVFLRDGRVWKLAGITPTLTISLPVLTVAAPMKRPCSTRADCTDRMARWSRATPRFRPASMLRASHRGSPGSTALLARGIRDY